MICKEIYLVENKIVINYALRRFLANSSFFTLVLILARVSEFDAAPPSGSVDRARGSTGVEMSDAGAADADGDLNLCSDIFSKQ